MTATGLQAEQGQSCCTAVSRCQKQKHQEIQMRLLALDAYALTLIHTGLSGDIKCA